MSEEQKTNGKDHAASQYFEELNAKIARVFAIEARISDLEKRLDNTYMAISKLKDGVDDALSQISRPEDLDSLPYQEFKRVREFQEKQ